MRLLIILGGIMALSARGAVRFDGTDDMLQASAANAFSAMNFTNVISISAWVMKEPGNANTEILGKGRIANGNIGQFHLIHYSDGFGFYFINPTSGHHIFTTSSTFPRTNVWIHVAFTHTFTSSNTAQFYVNGARVAGVWVLNPTNTVAATNADPFRIGATYAGSTVKGQIAEVAIWNAVLDDAEVQALARSGNRGAPLEIRRVPDALRGYWPMDNDFPYFTTASGTNSYRDLSPYGLRMTPANSPQQRPAFLSD